MTEPAKTRSQRNSGAAQAATDSGKGMAFTFGDPEAVLDRRELFDLFETHHNGKWYDPPVPMHSLARTYRMNAHHQSALVLKRNLLVASFIPSRWLSMADFSRWVIDCLLLGNGYLEQIPNTNQRVMKLQPVPGVYTRVGVERDTFWFLRGNSPLSLGDAHKFRPGSVFHLLEPDPLQEIYGLPEYLSALHSGLLNEAATIFRRRYYKNGSHAGFILYISEEGFSEADSTALRKSLREAKGVGNFRNLYLHIAKGTPDGVKLIPIGEVTAKDEFLNIKNITAQDMLVAHRVPPILLGVMPNNTGGFGNVLDAKDTFIELEIAPIQQRMLAVNDWLGVEAIRFKPPTPRAAAPAG